MKQGELNFEAESKTLSPLARLSLPKDKDMPPQLAEFKQHPKLVRAWLRAGKKRFENAPPDTSLRRKYNNVYEIFVMSYFYNSEREFREATSGMFGGYDCKKALEEYFGINLDID